ncbi:MAG: S24/S26 family peptidase [Methanosarcinaceae archaeon]|nr:S24/S26 family peptidase [Methanosarcinaceae archaeon]
MITVIMAFVLYNYIFFAVPVSDSMQPTFKTGDLVLMQKYNTEPHEGDIIMFGIAFLGQGSRVVTHRVYNVTPNGIQTKGDATPIDNWIIPQKQIYAKAIIINEKPIVLKSIGHYFLNTQLSSTYAAEFGLVQLIFREGKRLGLLIFATCIIIFGLLTVNDSIKHRKLRRRI